MSQFDSYMVDETGMSVFDPLHSELSDPVYCAQLTSQTAQQEDTANKAADHLPKINIEITSSCPVRLESLEVDEICDLLVHCKLSAVQSCVREQSLSGKILASYVKAVEDLIEVGMKVLHARALFDLIGDWKVHGLPQSFLSKWDAKTAAKSNEDAGDTGDKHEEPQPAAQRAEPGAAPKHEGPVPAPMEDEVEKRLQEVRAEKLRLEEAAVKRLKDEARQRAWRTCLRCHSASHIIEKHISWNGYGGAPYRLWCTACDACLNHRYTVEPSADFMP